MQRIFGSDSARGYLRTRNDPIGQGLRARLRQVLVEPEDGLPGIEAGFHAAGQAIVAWFDDDDAAAQQAAELCNGVVEDRWTHVSTHVPEGTGLWHGAYKMIMRTDPAVGVAIALSYAGERWDSELRQRLAEAVASQAEVLLGRGGQGWNGNAVSNWSANTGTAAWLCARACRGLIDAERLQHIEISAVDRIEAFLATGGERDWHQESWHYYRYAMGHHLLTWASARRAAGEPVPEPLRWAPLLYPLARVGQEARLPHYREDLYSDHFLSGELLMGAGAVEPDLAPVLAWELRDRCVEQGWDVRYAHHALIGLQFLPEEAVEPSNLLGHHWYDQTKSLLIWRRGFGTGDCFAVDANRHTSTGTGRPVCAGSFSWTVDGVAWASPPWTGGQDRSAHNVPVTATQDIHGEAVPSILDQRDGAGAALALDLAPVHGVGATRSFDLSWNDKEAILQVHDQLPEIGDWYWHGDGQAEAQATGWRAIGTSGQVMEVTVNGGGPVELSQDGQAYRVRLRGSEFAIQAHIRR